MNNQLIQNKKRQKVLVKILFFTISLALFSHLSSFPLALAILAGLFVHEYGHITGAKIEGVKTHGIYFLPGIGAVACIEIDKVENLKQEFIISIYGPLYGFFYAAFFYGLYYITKMEWCIVVAFVTMIINLLNLLMPVYPMDGGRIFRCIGFSLLPKKMALVLFMILGGLGLAFIFLKMSWFLGLFLILAFTSQISVVVKSNQKPMKKITAFASIFFVVVLAITFLFVGLPIESDSVDDDEMQLAERYMLGKMICILPPTTNYVSDQKSQK